MRRLLSLECKCFRLRHLVGRLRLRCRLSHLRGHPRRHSHLDSACRLGQPRLELLHECLRYLLLGLR